MSNGPVVKVCLFAFSSIFLGSSQHTCAEISRSDPWLGGGSRVKHAEVSGLKRFLFSSDDGAVFLSLQAAALKPNRRELGFLELPKHGVVLEQPVLHFKRLDAAGEDWAKTLRLLQELSLAQIRGPLTLKLPGAESWQCSGQLRRHPDGILFAVRPKESTGSKTNLLLGYDPKARQIFIREWQQRHQETP